MFGYATTFALIIVTMGLITGNGFTLGFGVGLTVLSTSTHVVYSMREGKRLAAQRHAQHVRQLEQSVAELDREREVRFDDEIRALGVAPMTPAEWNAWKKRQRKS